MIATEGFIKIMMPNIYEYWKYKVSMQRCELFSWKWKFFFYKSYLLCQKNRKKTKIILNSVVDSEPFYVIFNLPCNRIKIGASVHVRFLISIDIPFSKFHLFIAKQIPFIQFKIRSQWLTNLQNYHMQTVI